MVNTDEGIRPVWLDDEECVPDTLIAGMFAVSGNRDHSAAGFEHAPGPCEHLAPNTIEDHIERLRQLRRRYRPGLFSEHLAWSSHDAGFLNDLLPVPYTAETLERVVEPVPSEDRLRADPTLREERRRPMFVLIRARKPAAENMAARPVEAVS